MLNPEGSIKNSSSPDGHTGNELDVSIHPGPSIIDVTKVAMQHFQYGDVRFAPDGQCPQFWRRISWRD